MLSRCGVQTWNGRCGHRNLLLAVAVIPRIEVNVGDIPAVNRSMSDPSQERFTYNKRRMPFPRISKWVGYAGSPACFSWCLPHRLASPPAMRARMMS